MASSRPVSQNLWVRPIAALRWPASSFIGAGPRVSKVCTTHNVLPLLVNRQPRNKVRSQPSGQDPKDENGRNKNQYGRCPSRAARAIEMADCAEDVDHRRAEGHAC